jgi:hypothetical protein
VVVHGLFVDADERPLLLDERRVLARGLIDTLAVVMTVYFLNFDSRSVSSPGRP